MLRRHQRQKGRPEGGVGEGGLGEQAAHFAQRGFKRPGHARLRLPHLAQGPSMEAHDEQIGQGHGHIGRLEQGDAEETDHLQGPPGVLQGPKPGGAAPVHAAGIGPLPFQAERR